MPQPDQLRRGEGYRPDSSLKRFKIGRPPHEILSTAPACRRRDTDRNTAKRLRERPDWALAPTDATREGRSRRATRI
jgi:hypothetical protein